MHNRAFVLTLGLALVGSTSVWAATQASSFSRTEETHGVFEHSQFELYFNNSGGALTSGSVVIFDAPGSTGVNEGGGSSLDTIPTDAARSSIDTDGTDGNVTNIGTYITTTGSADQENVAGVIDDDSCADQSYCRVQTRGPRLVRCASSTGTTFVAGQNVGTFTTAGTADDGDGVGVALSACLDLSTDSTHGWVLIRPWN